jgi:hypothetical protein
MAKEHLYSVFNCNDGVRGERYHVTKHTKAIPDKEEEFYLVKYYPPRDFYNCGCEGFKRYHYCRHQKITKLFKEQSKVGSGQLYDYDNDRWSNYFVALPEED